MIYEVEMPEITMQVRAARLTMSAGYVLRWFVSEGDEMKKGDPLADIEEEKAVCTLESPANGRVKKIFFERGVLINAGSVICSIESEP